MSLDSLMQRMERFPAALSAAAATVSLDDARWKPSSGAWSILEICCHLLDEEREDFRPRIRFILEEHPGPWPPIDPQGWAAERGYNQADLPDTLRRFAQEREASLSWLRSLGPTDWSSAYQHPRFGLIRAGDLLAAWSAHDALHLRQIAKRLHELAGRDGEPFSTIYAGEWGP
ncbi:MAG: DinB family protein [Phycisphaeraceae bacterium]|nr:DinB family protein [Phycisphaeraceae bacterium]MCW5753158.1 DinB family protein [Phycisphaeraceae bacterium]